MHPIRIEQLSAEQHAELDHANRTAKDGRLRVRALIVLLAAERGMVAADIAAVVRMHEHTVRRWLVRYQAEGLNGLADAPRPGAAPRATRSYRDQLLAVVRRRPRALDLTLLALDRRPALGLPGRTHRRADEPRERVPAATCRGRAPEPAAAHHHEPRPGVRAQKTTVERARTQVRPGEVFYYADEFNISWHPTICALW